jgi:hypothetical protein
MNYLSTDGKIVNISGNSYSILKNAKNLLPDDQCQSLHITVSGAVVKTYNMGYYIWTVAVGRILIFPLFFTCCDWWKKKAFVIYNINKDVYRAIQAISQKYKPR